MKVVVHISQESFMGSSVKVAVYIYLKSHLQGSSLKVAVYISQESFRGKQFESCGAYLSRFIRRKQCESCGAYISRVI